MENNIEEQSMLTPPLKALVVNGKKKVAVNGVVNIDTRDVSVQADWNQNDENAPDYIKNRICYTTEENLIDETLHISSTTGRFIEADSSGVYFFNPSIPFVSGKTYKVQVGSTIYSFTVHGAPDNSAGSGGTSLEAGGFSVGWNINGMSGAPHGETAMVNLIGDPQTQAQVLGGNSFEILEENVSSINNKYIPQLGGVQFKISGSSLQASLDGGSTWQTVTLT